MALRLSRANLLTGLGLLLLLLLIVLGAPRWTRLLSQDVPVPDDDVAEERPDSGEEEPAGQVERTINVKLFFQALDRPGLVMEERTVPFSSDLAAQLEAVVAELIQGPRTGLGPTLPPETRVLEVFVSAKGVAYVDLSREAAQIAGGSTDELLSVYSVVNSLAANFPAVKRVQILVEDRPAQTLAGHVDLSHPLSPDMSLLAAADVTPAIGASPAASPPGSPPAASPLASSTAAPRS
ncbi:MAG TPA: GerMN domain-containing protein [Vicinamibacteria bacterium]|nr:GerMN domain-containing protein [Vicinamibacteria bacterium]